MYVFIHLPTTHARDTQARFQIAAQIGTVTWNKKTYGRFGDIFLSSGQIYMYFKT